MHLLRAQAICIYKTFEIVVVYKHKYFMLAAFQIVFPSFECLNNGQKFTAVSLVSCFNRYYLLKEKKYRMPLAQII